MPPLHAMKSVYAPTVLNYNIRVGLRPHCSWLGMRSRGFPVSLPAMQARRTRRVTREWSVHCGAGIIEEVDTGVGVHGSSTVLRCFWPPDLLMACTLRCSRFSVSHCKAAC